MIQLYIDNLIDEVVAVNLLNKRDCIYARNKLLALLKISSYEQSGVKLHLSIPQLLEKMSQDSINRGIIDDTFDDIEILKANIMDIFLDSPSVIEQVFYDRYATSAKVATDYFYQLSKHSNYIQIERINKNIHFKTDTIYGEMDITINMSKPEKTTEQIEREKIAKQHDSSYPPCVLCIENEGYEGRVGYAARANHRMIQMNIADEQWYFQYSPYTYYNEHSVLLSEKHQDMEISKQTFCRLFHFVEQFPHYFIGSNADLPIVGGSILSHDHYQAGNYTFAMERATPLFHFTFEKYPSVHAEVLEWPLTVIRIRSDRKEDLIEISDYILKSWQRYSDESLHIIAQTDGMTHNTITPIVRKRGEQFEIDLVLRNNRTNEEYPSGIFHPHEDVQHIKKENIGLIEVMGLAVLPARLKEELTEIKQFILNQEHMVPSYHLDWAKQLRKQYKKDVPIESFMQRELGKKFTRILEDAGVFKQDESGINGIQKFITSLRNEL